VASFGTETVTLIACKFPGVTVVSAGL
jgi:hypothetical protein